MNYFIFTFKSALADFARNKVRTLLTSLGILIGVLSVVLITAFGLGLRKYIKDQFDSLGTNLVVLLPGQIFNSSGGLRSGSSSLGSVRFDENDYIKLSRIRSAQYVVPTYTKTIEISGEGKAEESDLYTANEQIFPARNLTAQFGRVFTKEDVEKRSKVVVLGPKIAEKIFSSKEQALDRTVKIDKQSFRVIGILEGKGGGGFGGPDFDSFAYMPYTTGFLFNSDKKFFQFIFKAKSDNDVAQLKADITNTLLKRYKADSFSVIEQTEILNTVSQIFGVLNIALTAVATISLVVGGIGIMNIMYVSVTERTREIGIRRAIGARESDILSMFILEAVLLSLLGGALGVALAFIITQLVQSIFPAYVDLQSIGLALGVSSIIGVVFGVFPARKAAQLSPIDAIRFE